MINFELLREEANRHPYPLLFATISGAHLYGFPSPDSDYDLRGVHVQSAVSRICRGCHRGFTTQAPQPRTEEDRPAELRRDLPERRDRHPVSSPDTHDRNRSARNQLVQPGATYPEEVGCLGVRDIMGYCVTALLFSGFIFVGGLYLF